MVRVRNLITNNLSNAYAADAVSLRGETHAESAYRTRNTVFAYTYASTVNVHATCTRNISDTNIHT